MIFECAKNERNFFIISNMIIYFGSGYANVAKLLIENGADVNAKEKYGETPLHTSIFSGITSWNIQILNVQSSKCVLWKFDLLLEFKN